MTSKCKFWRYWKYKQKKNRQKYFRLKNQRNMRFSQFFWQNNYENANFNPHTNWQAYILSSIFVIGKIRIVEFINTLLLTTLTTPPTHTAPRNFDSFVVKGLVKITHSRLANFGCPIKLLGKNDRKWGWNNHGWLIKR